MRVWSQHRVRRLCSGLLSRHLRWDRARFHHTKHRASLFMRHPPFIRSIGCWEKMSRFGTGRGQSLCEPSPMPTARRQNGHVPLKLCHGREPVRIAHQYLQDCDLEVHLSDNITCRLPPHGGAWRSASIPTCLRRWRIVSLLVAAPRLFEATCARMPVSLPEHSCRPHRRPRAEARWWRRPTWAIFSMLKNNVNMSKHVAEFKWINGAQIPQAHSHRIGRWWLPFCWLASSELPWVSGRALASLPLRARLPSFPSSRAAVDFRSDTAQSRNNEQKFCATSRKFTALHRAAASSL
ncbi:hypothetical protein ABIA85_007883 [Bradyrhizobium sp. LA6.10]